MKIVYFLLMTTLLTGATALAQRNTLQYLRIYDDNDFFNSRQKPTDREYTNGSKLDVYYTKSGRRRFLSRLLIPISEDADNLYGIGVTQLMYTPSDISSTDVVYGSRPYCGVLFVSHTLTSSDRVRRQKITTELDMGVLGKAAMAGEVQSWYHKLINAPQPQGWSHQVQSDLVLNYSIRYEKEIVHPAPTLQLVGLVESNVGSLSSNLSLGLTFRAGFFSDYFSNYERPSVRRSASNGLPYRKRQIYFYIRPTVRFVMDDSTLQGGSVLNRTNEYVLNADDLTRINGQFDYGIIASFGRLCIGLGQKLRTAEYKGGPNQQYGNLSVLIGL